MEACGANNGIFNEADDHVSIYSPQAEQQIRKKIFLLVFTHFSVLERFSFCSCAVNKNVDKNVDKNKDVLGI